jgi:hypothetical protein
MHLAPDLQNIGLHARGQIPPAHRAITTAGQEVVVIDEVH